MQEYFVFILRGGFRYFLRDHCIQLSHVATWDFHTHTHKKKHKKKHFHYPHTLLNNPHFIKPKLLQMSFMNIVSRSPDSTLVAV